MKLQNLAVIFIIIILPISLILTSYVKSNVRTLDLQTTYDTKLNTATADALIAFQMNTMGADRSDIANSKLRYVEAAANTFYDAMATNFDMSGYNKDILKEYVPALVFTMYDGYYIYGPYTNTLSDEEDAEEAKIKETNPSFERKYKNGEKLWGVKPYIHYSCRYKRGSNDDFVITYSLDNYITIQGKINGDNVYDYGYLLNNVTKTGTDSYSYRGVPIKDSENLEEYIDATNTKYRYIKINGVKNYYDTSINQWFRISTDGRTKQDDLKNNISAKLYYKEALEFTDRVLNSGITTDPHTGKQIHKYNLSTLTPASAIDENLQPVDGFSKNIQIFATSGDTSIEDTESNFNTHRLEVIKYSIEKNLSLAIANYNNYYDKPTTFQMPKLEDNEWEKITHNVSIISFLQGLSIGGKVYNGHAIVTNTKNKESVSENSIYIVTDKTSENQGGYYYRITDKSLLAKSSFEGVLNIDFERKSIEDADAHNAELKKYFFPNRALMGYTTMTGDSEADTDNIIKYVANTIKNTNMPLATEYFTALGRERYSMYKSNNDNTELRKKFK